MSTFQMCLALVCVVAISFGQILFKRVGIAAVGAGTWIDGKVALYAGYALALYAGATLLWIYLLRFVDLSRAYPIMAISFVVVPFLSAWFFDDRLPAVYFVGVLLILSGIVIISRMG